MVGTLEYVDKVKFLGSMFVTNQKQDSPNPFYILSPTILSLVAA